ncbi:MAG: glycosyltransferase family 4 protein, partial [Prevotella sp.]|nr:glycosyltransferase family 4 protein [Prevotella sp.]
LQRRYPTSGKWIACSNVDISTGQSGVLEKRLENIKERQATGRRLLIGTAAAIDVPYKGQEYVIRAVAQLKSIGIDMEYHMIGLGDSSRLQSIIDSLGVGDRVHILGGLPHDKVTEFYDDIDIYVQPSKQEGLPRSTIEAMSRGCLCLGSAIAGIPELLAPEYLFPKGQVDRIVEILKNIKPEDLITQAKLNFEEAKDYDRDLLNERRRQFILDFKESIMHSS